MDKKENRPRGNRDGASLAKIWYHIRSRVDVTVVYFQ